MKIKGVYKDKNRAGEPMEFSAEEKVPLVLQEAVGAWPEFQGKYLTYTRGPRVLDLHYSPKGDLFKGKWQNNIYRASGTVTLHHRNVNTNAMYPPKHMAFTIKFEDVLDENGQPDLEAKELKLT